jgi:GDSL-like Lipase/Acylhydrolase family
LNLKTYAFLRIVIASLWVVSARAEQEFYTPEQDREGLERTVVIQERLPNILIIGDSISIGYTSAVASLLKDTANVQRAKVNCGNTEFGRKHLKAWLGKTRWDVIHFNWGLHDLCHFHPDSTERGNRDKVNGTVAIPLAEYEENLEAMVLRLKETGATLIWASTTRVPENEPGRFVSDAVKYNAAAAKIMKRHGIAINDLYTLSLGFEPSLAVAAGDVHFTKQGYAKLAAQVAKSIELALGKNATPPGRPATGDK